MNKFFDLHNKQKTIVINFIIVDLLTYKSNYFIYYRYDPLHGRFEDLPKDPPCLKEETKHK